MYRVCLRKKSGRPKFIMYYRDPMTGREVAKDSGQTQRSKAERAAQKWEDELNSGGGNKAISWDEFRIRFTDEHLIHLAENTQSSYLSALKRFKYRAGRIHDINAITASTISRVASELKKWGTPPTTIANILRHTKGALSWAARVGMIKKVPSFKMPPLSEIEHSRGRAITDAEFAKMRAEVKVWVPDEFSPCVTDEQVAERLLVVDAIWHSGLRIGEIPDCRWDQGDIVFDIESEHPCMTFREQGHKARRYEIVPMTPELVKLLRERIPKAKRTGRVFSLPQPDRVISAMGRAAGIVVASDGKFASAHDLRRSFLTRWADRVPVHVLQKMARHKSIRTTMKYYVRQEANELAKKIWNAK